MRGLALRAHPLASHAGAAVLAIASLLLWLQYGGYHPRTWAPVGLAVLAAAAAAATLGRLSAWRSPAGIVLACALALAAWTALSMTWAVYSRHLAWDEANRTLMYAAAFALGGAICASVSSFVRAASWLAAAGAAAGVVTWMQLSVGSEPTTLFVSGRLDWPIRYSNGVAAALLVTMWLLVGLSCRYDRRHASWREAVRAARMNPGYSEPRAWLEPALSSLALGAAVLVVGLAALAQSRGALVAGAASVVVALAVTPGRLMLLLRLGVIAAAVAAVSDALAAPFSTLTALRLASDVDAAELARRAAEAERAVQGAAPAIAVAALAAAVAGLVLPLAYARARESLRITPHGVAAAWAVVAVAAGVGAALLVAGNSGPASWVAANYRACVSPERAPDTDEGAASHFADVGSNRCDFWRVAFNNFRQRPLLGVGANNFQGPYVQQRRSTEEPRQAHSLPLQMLGELGLVGGLLAGAIVAIVAWAALRYARSGSSRDPTFAGAIAAMAYWLAHASLDWLWNLPAITLGVVALAGGLVACVSRGQRTMSRSAGVPIGVGLVLMAAASFVPQAIADHEYRAARVAALQGKRGQAVDHATDAARWNSVWAAPVMLVANQLADPQAPPAVRARAVEEARAAIRLEPRNWSIRAQASQVLARMARAERGEKRRARLAAAAQLELCAAAALNPQLEVGATAACPEAVPRP